MSNRPRQMILGILVNGSGIHQASWRRVGSRMEDAYSLSLYADVAQWAEEAKVHLLFYADSPVHSQDLLPVRPVRYLEAITLASAVAARTTNIGIVATASTTFSEPYNVARQMASLDHLSSGRAGWNIVTSYGGAEHFSVEPMPGHASRHKRAHEFVEIAKQLWDSWEQDAIVIDRERGIFADPKRVHETIFEGECFNVRGPLNMPRPPQGRPILAQAGSSDAGKDLAAAHADIVYTVTPTLSESQAYYSDVKSRTAKFGRLPDDVKILPGCAPVIGQTEAEARAIHRELNDLINFEVGLQQLQELLPGVDLRQFALDDVIPASALPEVSTVQTMQSRYEVYRYLAVERGYSIRRMIEFNCTAGGHWSPVGSAEQIADQMQERFENAGADGFNLYALFMPDGFKLLTQQLVPVLQDRGLFRTEYEGKTLRENLGLAARL